MNQALNKDTICEWVPTVFSGEILNFSASLNQNYQNREKVDSILYLPLHYLFNWVQTCTIMTDDDLHYV